MRVTVLWRGGRRTVLAFNRPLLLVLGLYALGLFVVGTVFVARPWLLWSLSRVVASSSVLSSGV